MSAPTLPERTAESTSSTVLLLTRVTVAFSRRRAYPETHPLVRQAEAQAFETLSRALDDHGMINITLGADELLVDGAPVTHAGTVAHDLAERLRRRGIGAISFDRSVTAAALSESFRFLATEPETADDGSIIASRPPELDGITIARIAYGRLALGNDDSNPHTQASDIWRLLASTALLDDDDELDGDGIAVDPRGLEASGHGHGTSRYARRGETSGELREVGDEATTESHDDIYGNADTTGNGGSSGGRSASPGGKGRGGRGGGRGGNASGDVDDAADETDADAGDILAEADPSAVAQAIERRLPRAGYAKRVAYVLLRVADQVAHAPADLRAMLGERLRSVLGSLQTSTIGSIIRSVGVGSEQRRFMAQMLDALPAGAIIEWLERAASATNQDLSHHLLRLLSKLSDRVDNSTSRPASESAFRGAARDLVNGWTLDDPNPNAHASLLDQICRYESPETHGAMPDPGTARIVQIALEVDVLCEDAADAARQMLDEGRVAELLQWVDDAPGRQAAAALQELIVSPEAIRSVLLRDPLDQTVARALLSSLDQRASEVLLDILRDAEGRTTRRLVYDRLREYGATLAPQLVRRLDGAPWYFVRNLLALLRDTAAVDGESVESPVTTLFKFLNHQHEQVRVEALRLLVADSNAREAAVRHVLDDSSERVIGIAIELITSDVDPSERTALSSDLGRRLLSFVQTSGHSDALVARAVRALSEVPPSGSIRDAMLALTSKKTWLMRRLVLTDTKPTMLAALEVLAVRYATDPQSRAVLDVGAQDRDPRVRRAARGESSRAPSAA